MAAFAGGCLCGAVRYESAAMPQLTGHCQCVDCRKTSGSGHCTHVVTPEAGFSLTGEVRVYERPADSGNLVGRAFCPICGAPVFSRNAAMPGVVFVRASSLDDPDILAPQMLVYASRGPKWDHVDPSLPRFATMPEGGPRSVMPEG